MFEWEFPGISGLVAERIASGAVIAGMSAALLTAASLAPVAADEHARDRDKGFVGWVQPEKLSWRPFTVAGLPDAQARLLSLSKATGF